MAVSAPTNTRAQDNAGPVSVTSYTMPKTAGTFVSVQAGVPYLVYGAHRESTATADFPTVSCVNDVGASVPGDTFTAVPGLASGLLFNTNIHRAFAFIFKATTAGNRFFTVTTSDPQTYWAVGIERLNDVDPTTPIPSNVATATGTSTAPSATHAGMDPQAASIFLLFVATNTATVSEPSGFTYTGGTSNSNVRIRTSYQLAPTTTVTGTLSTSSAWGAVLIELAPVGGSAVTVPVVLSFTLDPDLIPGPEVPNEPPPVELPPIVEPSGAPGVPPPIEVQSPYARPRAERATDMSEIVSNTTRDIAQIRSTLAASYGTVPVYGSAEDEPVAPPDGSVWWRSDTRQRITRMNGVNVVEQF